MEINLAKVRVNKCLFTYNKTDSDEQKNTEKQKKKNEIICAKGNFEISKITMEQTTLQLYFEVNKKKES